jgi:hypothetical protein
MASFIRQVNIYGFAKIMVVDPQTGKREAKKPISYWHPYFLRGRPDLLRE